MKNFLIVLTSVLLLCVPIPILAEEPESNQEALVKCLKAGVSSWSQCHAEHNNNEHAEHNTNQLIPEDAQSSGYDKLQELLKNEMQKRSLFFAILPWTPTPPEIVLDYVIN